MAQVYRIGQVAEMTGLTEATLRYYEAEELVVPARTASNIRQYSERDVTWVRFIMHMRATGMGIADLRRYVKLRAEGPGTEEEILEILRRHERRVTEQLTHLQLNLRLIRYKIGLYESGEGWDEGTENRDLFELFEEQGGTCAGLAPEPSG